MSTAQTPLMPPAAPQTVTPEARRSRSYGFMSVYGFVLLPYLIPVLVVSSALRGGMHNLVPMLVIFGIVPVLDLLIGQDPYNPPEDTLKTLGEKAIFRWVTHAYVPLQTALVIWGAWFFATHPMSGLERLLFVMSMGTVTGALGITFAHELCHKANRLEQTLGRILLVTVCYGHFHIEHNFGHHVNVSTPKDPASSRLGESFYRFYPRTVIGSFKSAWHLETRRLERSGRGVWNAHNQMLWFTGLPILVATVLGLIFGWMAVPYFFGQSIMAFSLLEVVNYIEHYGLERKEITPGRYERVNPLHSWNSNNRLTNGFLIMLQRHSDHHANPQRRYQTLRHFDESPQMPTGYAGMILLALVPPLWRKTMDPRVMEFRTRLADQRDQGAQGE